MATRSGISIHTLTETKSMHAQAVIKELGTLCAETFSQDPYEQEMFTDSIQLKVQLGF